MAKKEKSKSLTQIKEALEDVSTKSEPKEDRSEFNCLTCKGLGLSGKDRLKNDMICSECQGTGKV